jgi:hypothetical protein
LFFFLLSFFRDKAKNGSWGIMVSTKRIGGAGFLQSPVLLQKGPTYAQQRQKGWNPND